MADRDRQQFQLRRGQALGDKLIWRYPLASEDGRRALAGLGDLESVTVGYYRRLDDVPWAYAFFPLTSDQARAALGVPAVQRRIMDDLLTGMDHGGDSTTR